MGLFDSLFGKKTPSQSKLPPIHGGDGSSAQTPAVVNCASMSMANHLIDQFISLRHGPKDVSWNRDVELFVNEPGIPDYTVRAIVVKLTTGEGPTYYFNVGRPMNATKELMGAGAMGEHLLAGVARGSSTVVAHILDPNSGYTTQQWNIGEHIKEEAVSRLGDGGNVFVVVSYEAGRAKQVICKREIWNQVRAQFDGIDQAGSDSMRRTMDELNKLR